MDVNQCMITNKIETDLDQFPDGFSCTLKKYLITGETKINEQGIMEPVHEWSAEKGPFHTIRDAVVYAHKWQECDNPPAIPEFVPESKKPKENTNQGEQGQGQGEGQDQGQKNDGDSTPPS